MEHHFHLYDEETGTLTDFSNSSLFEALKSFIDSEKVENFELSSFSLQINGRKKDSTKPVNINSK
jgi:Fe2+ or Zn2+ uptake regulation protein